MTNIAKKSEFHCDFCGKDFLRESTLFIHLCKKKQRWLSRDEKYMKVALYAYKRFFATNFKIKADKTFEDFAESKFFDGFVKFGKYIISIECIDPHAFVEFVIKSGLALDLWSDPRVYEMWVREQTKKESPDKALERMLLLMESWAMHHNKNWTDFFREISPSEAVLWIETGRISPWILYIASSAICLIERLSDDQVKIVNKYVEDAFWQSKLKQYKNDVEMIRNELDVVNV